MTFLTVDSAKCNQDGICAAECPSGVIQMNESTGLPEPTPDAADHCIRCGHCVAVCPESAMMVGYPKFRYHRIPRRNAPKIAWT